MTLTNVIAAEFRKVFTTRIWWLLLIVLVVYVGFTAVTIGGLFAFGDELPGGTNAGMGGIEGGHALIYSLATALGYMFPVLMGALSTTAEFRHQTVTPTFLATPRRGLVLAAKAIALAVVGAIFGIGALVGTMGLGAPLLLLGDLDAGLGETDTWLLAARIVLAMALWAVVGVGLGALIPSQVAAIVVVIVFTQFIEPVVRFMSALWEPAAEIGRYLPGAASDALVGASLYTSLAAAEGGPESLAWWQGGLVLAAIAVAALIAGWLTTWRKDVT